MSRCTTKVLSPGEIEFEFTITLKLSEWQEIRDDLGTKWSHPMSGLADSIISCTAQAEKVFFPQVQHDD